MTTSYAGLLRRCETDPDVVGLVLSGSHARNMATEHSDFDDGQIAELVHAQATLTPTESDTLVREQLDGYINCAGNSTLTRCADKPPLDLWCPQLPCGVIGGGGGCLGEQ